MAEQTKAQVFISYSRKDSDDVEKLAASLVGLGYSPWVDRNRLEGGMNWEREIAKAIEGSIAFVLALTPDSAQSEWVDFEFKRAHLLKKMILPLLYKPVDFTRLPVGWGGLQFIDMQRRYEDGLAQLDSRLRSALAVSPKQMAPEQSDQKATGWTSWIRKPSPAKAEQRLSPDEMTDIYRRAAQAIERQDFIEAERLLRELVDDNPQALGGSAQVRLREIQPLIKQQRISNLEGEAVQAKASGNWRQEYATLEQLQTFRGLSNSESGRIALAKHNRQFQDTYNLIIGLVEDMSYSTAKTDLQNLWTQAPEYGDPAKLARTLGIPTPKEIKAIQNTQKEATAFASSAVNAATTADSILRRVNAAITEATAIATQLGTPEAAVLLRKSVELQGIVQTAAKESIAAKDAATTAAKVAGQAQSLDAAQSASRTAKIAAEKAVAAQLEAERAAKEI